ncbi:RNA polymerase sigma factor [Mucilaginibacter phyllosphaerae]|nr:RNA polymerase sigma factor [Mucilaginibacter phyllosphaerae]MBB3968073.1 RNA polymerase sigma-70 factor (ECF subfamily) [Mucilaginibacter phyllosphaerae]
MLLIDDAELYSLVNRLRNGDERAFNTLYHTYFKPLYGKVFSMVKDEAIADELIQELFLKVWQKREELNPDYSFTAFLYKITNNMVFDFFRKVAKDSRLAAKLIINATEYYLHSDELLESKEARQVLTNAINQLSPQRKLIFTYCKLEGKSYEEASRNFGLSVATINSHITQSLKAIRQFVAKNYLLVLMQLMLSLFNKLP